MIEHRSSALWVIQAHTIYAPTIDRDAIVVDLGASDGVFSKAINGATGCHCYAVEASPNNFAKIETSDNIEKFHYAIKGSDGEAEFSIVDGYKHRGTLVLPVEATSVVTIPTRSLESLLDEIGVGEVDLLKIDIEGAEIEMLESTSDETLRSMKQITIEFHDFVDPTTTEDVDRAIKRLDDLGFDSIFFSKRNRCDVLFLNRKYIRLSPQKLMFYRYFVKYGCGAMRILGRYFAQ